MSKVEQKYIAEEQGYWNNFYQELNELKHQLDVTNVELAEGLGISRQSLVTFFNSPNKEKLPITRANILQLFDRLTDSKVIQESKKISIEAKHNREKFKEKGLERLLNAAGLTNVTYKQHLDVDSNRYYLIENIINRLSNLNFSDADFSKLITDIETQISNSINMQTKEITYVNQKQKEEWIDKTFVNSKDSINETFICQMRKYESLGKTEFTSIELSELYMNILVNRRFFNSTSKYLKFQIVDCNFITLTFPIQKDIINHKNDYFEKILNKIENKADKYLGQDIKSSPVVKVLITYCFKVDKEYVNWHFSSSGTHITNLLSAVEHGMGYCSSILELTDLSTKNLGIKSHSLAKTVVGLSEVDNRRFYRGSWVTGNAIIGTIQALVNAGTEWLSSMLDDKDSQEYYTTCKQIAEIQDKVVKINKLLSEYILGKELLQEVLSLSRNDEASKSCIIERCSNTIDEIKKLQDKISVLTKDKKVFNFYDKYLDKTIHTVKLLSIYAALLKGDLEKMEDYHIHAMDYSSQNNQYEPIVVLYRIVDMVYRFFSGDEDYINKKQWRDQEHYILDKLRNYIKTGTIGDQSSNGYIDVTEYRSASEYFGNISKMEFYACSSKDIVEFEKNIQQCSEEPIECNIIDNFLVAAYYAAKIGEKQRTVHWLLMASRTYCRLREKGKAETLIEVAKTILDKAIDPKYFFNYRESIKTEVELVRGEIDLHEQMYEVALQSFLKSLRGSIYLELTLLVADNLYNIFRTARKLEPERFYELYKENFLNKQENSNQKYPEDNKILKNVISFLNDIKQGEQVYADKFKYQAQQIWEEWYSKKSRYHTENEKHIIVKMMKNGTFLDYLPDSSKASARCH